MKTAISRSVYFFLSLFIATITSAQDSIRNEHTFYTFIYNQVPEGSCVPLIGLINVAEGNHDGAQVGFTNLNQKNFNGAQVGFTNAIGKRGSGSQVGFVNACRDSFSGAQVGFVNGTGGSADGMQVGFVNATKQSLDGGQVGYVNVTGKNVAGAQVGFINVCKDTFAGAQIGFVNTTCKTMGGTQIGFVNMTCKTIGGTQIGFVNVADSLRSGIPIGFVSYVRKGGYRALEAAASELYPANLSFKLGVKYFYTSIGMSYNPEHHRQFAWSAGFGGIFKLSEHTYFNPEFVSQHSLSRDMQHFLTLQPLFGYHLSERFSVVAGPTVVWSSQEDEDTKALAKPLFSIYSNDLNSQNRLHAGARLAIRYQFR